MKTKRTLIIFSIVAVIAALLLLSLRAYYIFLFMIIGLLLIGHREIWSLIKYRQLPVIDERVRDNFVKSIRNAGIFFVIAAIFLMLVLSGNLLKNMPAVHIVGYLFVFVCAVYLFSYLFYDRSEPNLGEKALRWLRIFVITGGISVGIFIISSILHNLISGLISVEEPVFFIIAVFISPAALVVGLLGSMVFFVKGLTSNLRQNNDGSKAYENEN